MHDSFHKRSQRKSKRVHRNARRRKVLHTTKDNIYRVKPMECEVIRPELVELNGKEISFSGEFEMVVGQRLLYEKNMLVTNVVVNGDVYVDHVWVTIKLRDQIKLRLNSRGNRVYMTGKVYQYIPKGKYKSKFGITNVKLAERI